MRFAMGVCDALVGRGVWWRGIYEPATTVKESLLEGASPSADVHRGPADRGASFGIGVLMLVLVVVASAVLGSGGNTRCKLLIPASCDSNLIGFPTSLQSSLGSENTNIALQ